MPAPFNTETNSPPADKQYTRGCQPRAGRRVTISTSARSAPPGSRSVMKKAIGVSCAAAGNDHQERAAGVSRLVQRVRNEAKITR